MSLHRWLQDLRSALAPGRGQRHPLQHGALRAGTQRLSLEVLEDRLTPSFGWDGAYYSEPPAGVVWTPAPLLADFTSDGILDQISVNVLLSSLAIRPGRGDGTFGDPIMPGIYAPNGAQLGVADFNGDGRLDVFVASNTDWQGLHWGETLLGLGNGRFYLGGEGLFPLDFAAPFASDIAVGTKVNLGTGRTDVVAGGLIGEYGPAVYVVLFNNGDWAPPPPALPSLSIDDVTVTEGNAGAVSATFTVTLSAASSDAITVNFATGDATATGGDYQAASGALTFAPGKTSKTITVLVNGDRLAEPHETFVVNLSAPTNANIADGQGVGSIVDDEPRVSINDVSKKEGKRGHTTLFTFTVTLSTGYDQPVTMSYKTTDGTATTGDNDYIAKTGTLTFNPGETTKSITIEVKGDSKKEADETFYLDLFGKSSNSLFTKSRGIGTILNDD